MVKHTKSVMSDQAGRLRKRIRHVPQPRWAVFIRDHHKGFIDWETYEMNQSRIAKNTHPTPHQARWRSGKGRPFSRARHVRPVRPPSESLLPRKILDSGVLLLGQYPCQRPGTLLYSGWEGYGSMKPLPMPFSTPSLLPVSRPRYSRNKTSKQTMKPPAPNGAFRSEVHATRANGRRGVTCSVEPENRLVARTLEAEWEKRLAELASAEAELERGLGRRPGTLTDQERIKIRALGTDLKTVWEAPTTTDRDRKELLHALLDEVNIAVAELRPISSYDGKEGPSPKSTSV